MFHPPSIKMFMLCLFTCVAYLVTLRMDTMCTRVSCCVDWTSMSWFTCSLILLTSFVVAVPVSHLRALHKKGNRLLLRWLLLFTCPSNEGSVFRRLIAEMMVGLQESYISLILVNSTCSVDIKWAGVAGQWLRNCNSWHVLTTCLLNYFQWHSRCPSVLVICVQWLSMNGMLDMPSKLVEKELILLFLCWIMFGWGWSCIRCCN